MTSSWTPRRSARRAAALLGVVAAASTLSACIPPPSAPPLPITALPIDPGSPAPDPTTTVAPTTTTSTSTTTVPATTTTLPSSITAVMLPPSAGSNPSVPTAGFTVAFGDAGSTNSSGAVTGYSWDFGDATSSSNSATGAFTSHIYAAPGTYQVTLTVTGANSAPGSATTSVVVAGAPAIVPVITFSPAHPTVGQPVTFSSVGSTDSAGTISNYLWQAHDISMTFGPTVTHTFTSAGITTVSLTVFGDHGDSTTNFVLLNVG